MTASLPLVGEEFAGYRLRSVLGRGGMSVVYEAENLRLGSTVALKVLAPELATQDVFRSRFLQESRVAASLNHPNVIPIYDTGPCGELLYIAMRFVSGADLRAVLKTYGHISPDQALLLVGQAGRGLDAAHRKGLVHRDVKPANILIERGEDDEPDHVYLADFGITKHALSKSGLTATGQFVGTIDYIAPEQIRDRPVDARTDIYSLACVLYECVTGRVPFQREVDAAVLWAHVEEQAPAPSTLQPGLPPGLDAVILRALAKNPEERYSSCREFMNAARAALETSHPRDTTVMAGPPSVLAAPPAAATRPATGESAPRPAAEPVSSAAPADPLSAPAAAEPVTSATAHGGGGPAAPRRPARGSRHGGSKRRGWRGIAAAGVIAAALAGGAVALGLSSGGSSASSKHAGSSSTMAKKPAPPPNRIMQVLRVTNESADAKGLIPPSTCKPMSASLVMCSHSYLGADSVKFQTYPTLNALYTAYVTSIKTVSGSPYRANFNDCNPTQTNGEASWNHAHHHPKIYTLNQLAMGRVNDNQAAGRVFCTFSNSELHMVWTQNDGRMLAQVDGAPHLNTWDWWYKVHHNIDFSSSGMQMGSNGSMSSTTSTTQSTTSQMQMSTSQ